MKTHTIKITDDGLAHIQNALECYSRLGINQYAYCLEHNPAFAKLDWDERVAIEEYLKFKIDGRGLGIYHPEVSKFTKAYEIKKEIELHRAISEQPIMEHTTRRYDGALHETVDIPKFIDEHGNKIEHKIVLEIPKKSRRSIKMLLDKQDYNRMWNYIENTGINKDIKGEKWVLSEDLTTVTIYKPYKSI